MSDGKYQHVQAAFINAIREEGTKAEACDTLQALWNERCAQAAELTRLRAQVAAADRLAAAAKVIAKTMPDMLTAGDAIRGLSALGRDSLEGEVIAVRAALSAYEEIKE